MPFFVCLFSQLITFLYFLYKFKNIFVTPHTVMWIRRMLINCNSALSYIAMYLCAKIKHKPTSHLIHKQRTWATQQR